MLTLPLFCYAARSPFKEVTANDSTFSLGYLFSLSN
jgi:hypothetical protein